MRPTPDTRQTSSQGNRGRAFGNPLAVIAALIGVVEAAFAYPVTKLAGVNQTIVILFMVIFPFVLLLTFFLIVWFKPAHLYAPKDYQVDKSFLDAIGKAQPSGALDAAGIMPRSRSPRQIPGKKMREDATDVTPVHREATPQEIDFN